MDNFHIVLERKAWPWYLSEGDGLGSVAESYISEILAGYRDVVFFP